MSFTFHGFDGNKYRAELVALKHKIATIRYIVWSAFKPLEVTAYLSDLGRLTLPVEV